MLETLVTSLHVIVCLFLILVVLVQGGHSGGVGAAFGGGNSSGVFGATGATSLLGKLTYASAGIFMLTSIYLVRDHRTGVLDKVKEKAAEQAEASPAEQNGVGAASGATGDVTTEAPALENTENPAPASAAPGVVPENDKETTTPNP